MSGSGSTGGSDSGDMGDGGYSVQGAETAVGEETANYFEDYQETEPADSAYGTMVHNSLASSTETINEDPNSVMEVDDEVASNSTVQVTSDNVASNMGLRCDGCKNHFDCQTHVVLSGDCGHAQCSSCWAGSNNLCSTCHNYSRNMQPAFPLTARDMMSPERIDEPMEATANSMSNKGVCLKSSIPDNSTEPEVKTAKLSHPSTAAMSKGVLLKNPTHNSTEITKPLTGGVKVKPCQPSGPASNMAEVKIKCMDGRNLQEKLDPTKTTVGGLKQTINQKMGISAERQNLLHQGKTMTNTRNLHSYNVANGSTIQMAERCSGG